MNYIKNTLNHIDYSSFSLLFIAEGFTSSQEQIFYDQIFKVYDRISDYECFTRLKQDNSRLSLLSLYIPSVNSGTATTPAGAIGNTTFESYIDATGLHINYQKLESVINDTTIVRNGNEEPLAQSLLINKDSMIAGTNFILPVIIFPESTSPIGELEFLDQDKYYFVATTMDNYYEQIIVRAFAKIIGLGDEFDLEGPEYLEADTEHGNFINEAYINLFYCENPSTMAGNNPEFKWLNLFPQDATYPISIHPHPNSGTTADRSFPTIPLSYKKVEMWEGGGYYRKKVYRSATDCLQRRRIGDNTLPVKNAKVSLCPVCNLNLRKLL